MQGPTPRQQLDLAAPETTGKPTQSNSVAVGETTSSGNINLTMAIYVIFPHVLESPKGDPKTSGKDHMHDIINH